MAFSKLETDILLLSDAGFSARSIARDLAASPSTVSSVISRYAMRSEAEVRAERALRAGSRELLVAIQRERAGA